MKTLSGPGGDAPAPELDFGDRMIMLLTVAYPNAQSFGEDDDLGDLANDLYHDELVEMGRRFGETRVETSIRKRIRTSVHLPRIAEIREGIGEDYNARSRYDPDCACRGSGFRQMPTSPGSPTRWAKCDCYKRKAGAAA